MAIPVLGNGQLGLGLGPEAGQVLAEVGLQGPAVELVLRQHFAGFWLAGGSVLHDGRRGTHRYSRCQEGSLYTQVGVACDEARLRRVRLQPITHEFGTVAEQHRPAESRRFRLCLGNVRRTALVFGF